MEIWKDIIGYESFYQVSNLGRVKSLNYNHTGKEEILKEGWVHYKNGGYRSVNLCKNGKRKTHLVHRLVAEAFIPNPDNLPCINHKDENPSNNCVNNLEWCTQEYNINYGSRNKKVSKKLSKPLLQLTKDLQLIKLWESASEVEKNTGFLNQNITACCKGRIKTAYGYVWKYAS